MFLLVMLSLLHTDTYKHVILHLSSPQLANYLLCIQTDLQVTTSLFTIVFLLLNFQLFLNYISSSVFQEVLNSLVFPMLLNVGILYLYINFLCIFE